MYKKILVTLDGSAASEEILSQLAHLKNNGNEIHLLRVANAHVVPGMDPSESQVQVLKDAEEYLVALEGDLKKQGYEVKSHVCFGHPAEEIINHAAHWKYDLIAMTTHGRTGVGRLVMGSVTERVIRNSPVPVLVYRSLVQS